MNTKIKKNYDVVIVGAGPVGVVAGNFLGLYGVKTLIVDREKDVLEIPRAIGLDEEGSRILQAIGLFDDVQKDLPIADYVKMTSPWVGTIVKMKLDDWINGFPRLRMIKQPDVEKKLRLGLKRFKNVDFVKETEMTSFQDCGDGVELVLSKQEEDYRVSTKFLIGADGANSSIRQSLGIEYKGRTYSRAWLVVDALNGAGNDRSANFLCDSKRPGVTMPAPKGGRRWEFELLDSDTQESMLDDNTIAELLAPWGSLEELDIERKAVYTFHARIAEEFQKDNVFLVGDAAHITPPYAGQGLMAGFRDASNLCWKLSQVIKGTANKRLLQSYGKERIKNVKQMITLAIAMGMVITPKSRIVCTVRDAIYKLLGVLPITGKFMNNANVKPNNSISTGILLESCSGGAYKSGQVFPQGLVTCKKSHVTALQDEFIGPNWVLVGINLDPSKYLTTTQLKTWQSMSGQFVEVRGRALCGGEAGELTQVLLDNDGVFKDLQSKPVVMIVRPDRHIAGVVKPEYLNVMVDDLFSQLGSEQNTDDEMVDAENVESVSA